MDSDLKNDQSAAQEDDRKPWIDPKVTRMKATDAAAGANPMNPEGLALGS